MYPKDSALNLAVKSVSSKHAIKKSLGKRWNQRGNEGYEQLALSHLMSVKIKRDINDPKSML